MVLLRALAHPSDSTFTFHFDEPFELASSASPPLPAFVRTPTSSSTLVALADAAAASDMLLVPIAAVSIAPPPPPPPHVCWFEHVASEDDDSKQRLSASSHSMVSSAFPSSTPLVANAPKCVPSYVAFSLDDQGMCDFAECTFRK
jgi:hypothetical protein